MEGEMMNNKTIRKFILEALKPFKLLIIAQLTMGVIWAVDLSLRPYLLKIMIDRIPNLQSETVIDELSGPIFLYLGMSLVIVILMRGYDFVGLKLNPPLRRHVVKMLMKRMMEHSLTLFHNHFAGNLASKIKDVRDGIPSLLKVSVNQFFCNFMVLIVATFTVWTIDYKFSILLLIWLAIFIVGSVFFSGYAKKLSDDAAEARSVVTGQIVDVLGNIMSVHLFAGKDTEAKKLNIYLDDLVAAAQRRDWWFLGMFAFQGISFIIYQAIGFAFLIAGFKEGTVTAGDFALLISVNIKIIDTLWSLGVDIMTFSELVGEITQGLRIALTPLDLTDKPSAKTLQVTEGSIVFDKVRFHYKDAESLFHNKSIIIHPGQKVGLVGYSGGGKSTFANLILRLYDVAAGEIFIDGQSISEVTQESLRKNIAMIPQDPSLFHRSLMENIRYGRIEATDEEVIQAAKRAYAHDFIIKLPRGYNSLAGERGVKISGGQRQRIAIARAILKNAPILILDEATSQLDSVTENEIQDSLWELMQGKTTLVIAHRLSTLLHMDRILVFERGKIVEDGSPEELLAKGGVYKTLWDAQVGGFLPDKKVASL
jgi:ATP-binding cassette subfamily B protein